MRTFKLSDPPRFEAKLRDVIAVYEKKGPDVVRLSFDEKLQMQSLDRTHDHVRHSTLSLLAALDRYVRGHNRQATLPQWEATADAIPACIAQIRRTYEMVH